MGITITEALAELKTIDKKLEKKRQFVLQYLYRQNLMRDPLEPDDGSKKVLESERQSIRDLENRKVLIRKAILNANSSHSLTILGETKSIQEWLTWRRDVVPTQQQFLAQLKQRIEQVKREAQSKALTIVVDNAGSNPNDIIMNVSEGSVAKESERLEEILGVLDGQLSLKNATVLVDI